jgi:hypothetical protein
MSESDDARARRLGDAMAFESVIELETFVADLAVEFAAVRNEALARYVCLRADWLDVLGAADVASSAMLPPNIASEKAALIEAIKEGCEAVVKLGNIPYEP